MKAYFYASWLLLTLSGCTSASNFHTASFPLSGNCTQCEKLIEEAFLRKNGAQVNWDAGTQQAYVLFDPTKTTLTEIQKRIAYAGWDTPEFRAPDEVYASLPACCKYKRTPQTTATPLAHQEHGQHHSGAGNQAKESPPPATPSSVPATANAPASPPESAHKGHDMSATKTEANPVEQHDAHANHKPAAPKPTSPAKAKPKPATTTPAATETDVLHAVYTGYFAVKDALVKDDSRTAANKAAALEKAVGTIPMNKMTGPQHAIWMKHSNSIKSQAGQIARGKNLASQRAAFAALSASMESVIKEIPPAQTVYIQHCPMFNNNKGANWISREKTIRNPYYGPAMLSCGRTLQTIK